MWSIVPGIGRLVITKILTPLLGAISPAHLKNSSDLLNQIKDIDIANKVMSSIGIKSLCTNIPLIY